MQTQAAFVCQIPIYRAIGSIKIDNGQCTMDNYSVAYGDNFNIFALANTTIVNSQLSIVHSARSALN